MALGAMSDGRNLDAVALLRNLPSPKRLAVSTLLTAPMPNPLPEMLLDRRYVIPENPHNIFKCFNGSSM